MNTPRRVYALPHDDPRVVDDAPSAFEHTIFTRTDPLATFDAITDLSNEANWFPDFVDAGWETAAPHGPGSVRWYQTDAVWLREHFLRWDPGVRLTFAASAISLPFVTTFGEDYRFTPTSDGTRLDWRISYTPRAIFRPLHPIIRPYFGRTFRIAARRLEEALGTPEANAFGARDGVTPVRRFRSTP